MKKFLSFFAIIIAVIAISFVVTCGSDNPADQDQIYKGPGSQWTAQINTNNTFTLTESDAGWAMSGTWATTAAGYKKLTVTAASGASVPPVGSQAYVLDIPGTVLLMKPLSDSPIIAMVKANVCPSADFAANWIVTNTADVDDITTRDVFGTFSYTHATTTGMLPYQYTLAGSVAGTNQSLGTLTCTNGIASITDGTMYLTSVGGAIVHTNGGTSAGNDDDVIVGMPSTTIANLAALDGNYVGIHFGETSGSDDVEPIAMTLTNGTGSAGAIDPDTGISDGSAGVTVTLSAINTPSAGFISGTVAGSALKCMANVDVNGTDKDFLFCIGNNPGESGKLYNVLLISK